MTGSLRHGERAFGLENIIRGVTYWGQGQFLEPVRVSVSTVLDFDAARGALAHAVEDQTYWDPRSRRSPFYRLKGADFGPIVSLEAWPYVLPGIPTGAGHLTLKGTLAPLTHGCELTLDVTEPIRAVGTIPRLGPLLIRAWQRNLRVEAETLRLFLDSILAG